MWPAFAVAFLATGLACGLLYVWVRSRQTERAHREMASALFAAARCERRELAGYSQDALPAPVRRYLARAIPNGRRPVSRVRIRQAGVFRTREQPEQWKPFDAVQYVTTWPPGFVWDATVRMAPLFSVRVVDAYLEGAGRLRARLLGAVTVADEVGPQIDSGEMLRYLSEALWYPTALVPSERLRWRAVDENSAWAVLADRGREAAVRFYFDEEGLVSVMEAERFRIENGSCRLQPWRIYCAGYEVRDGFLIPLEARVAWRPPEGEMEYFRGRVLSIEYDP